MKNRSFICILVLFGVIFIIIIDDDTRLFENLSLENYQLAKI